METNKTTLKDEMRNELADLRSMLDTLRVRANLAGMEAKQKGRETLDEFERRYDRAKAKFDDWKRQGKNEWDAVSESIEAGWAELKRTYQEVKTEHGRQDGPR